MQHLKNINKLFNKNFVESPLIETFDAGSLHLSSGKLVVSDPLITPDKLAFLHEFPKGNFPVLIHKEKESNCIAYVEIVFANTTVSTWEMAVCEGQHLSELKEGEIFGYPVESGMGCFMDWDTQEFLQKLENDLFHSKGVDFMGIYEEFFHPHFFDQKGAIDQFAFLKPNDKLENNMIAFETGYGEGFYASFIGLDEHHKVVKLISELIEIKVS